MGLAIRLLENNAFSWPQMECQVAKMHIKEFSCINWEDADVFIGAFEFWRITFRSSDRLADTLLRLLQVPLSRFIFLQCLLLIFLKLNPRSSGLPFDPSGRWDDAKVPLGLGCFSSWRGPAELEGETLNLLCISFVFSANGGNREQRHQKKQLMLMRLNCVFLQVCASIMCLSEVKTRPHRKGFLTPGCPTLEPNSLRFTWGPLRHSSPSRARGCALLAAKANGFLIATFLSDPHVAACETKGGKSPRIWCRERPPKLWRPSPIGGDACRRSTTLMKFT